MGQEGIITNSEKWKIEDGKDKMLKCCGAEVPSTEAADKAALPGRFVFAHQKAESEKWHVESGKRSVYTFS